MVLILRHEKALSKSAQGEIDAGGEAGDAASHRDDGALDCPCPCHQGLNDGSPPPPPLPPPPPPPHPTPPPSATRNAENVTDEVG